MSNIKINDLRFKYNNTRQDMPYVLDGLELSIGEGETVGIIGANGVGKSTFLKLLVGLLPGYEGSILVDDVKVCKENLAKVRSKAGYVFQDSESQLFMNTIYEDVAFGPMNMGLSKEEVEKVVADALKKTHIEDLADRQIYRISGGQKKLAAIASVLSMGPDILLMDEPSVALDPSNRENLIDILNELPGTKLLASHDLDFIYDTCERTILLAEGKIAYDGPTKTLLKDKEMLEAHGLKLPLSFRFMTQECRDCERFAGR